MKKKISKPENWQDFESLCKKLWGEIWRCSSEIKKNGRQGQKQLGVDIYAVPSGKNLYWGIQCKGKDDYTNAKLATSEIDAEIEKAKLFVPSLEGFIFATTANKDAELEEYVRIKDLESRNSGLFSIHLYCWEDIVDLIEENRETYSWYVQQNQFKSQHDFQVCWGNNNNIFTINPLYNKLYNSRNPKQNASAAKELSKTLGGISYNNFMSQRFQQRNLSWCDLEIYLINTGSAPLEDWKVYFYFDKEFKSLTNEFEVHKKILGVSGNRTTFIDPEEGTILYKPLRNETLVQTDSKVFDIILLPKKDCSSIKVNWKLVARDFSKQGDLELLVKPEYRYFIDGTPRKLDPEIRGEINVDDFNITIEERLEKVT
ncbi:MAG: hypothetical protein AB7I41_03135 [Candidatus Sericytochromatia bacterium]